MSRLWRFVVVQVGFLLVLLAIWWKPEIDDSYIFLTYARHLASSGLFAFNPGEVSYGFSSPAYVLLLAGVSRATTIPVGIALSNLLGVMLCVLSSAALWALWDTTGGSPSDKELLPAGLLMSGPWFFTVWFAYGMEAGLAVCGLLGFLLWLAKLRADAPRLPWLIVGAFSASVLALTRLESGIYIAIWIMAAAVVLRSKRKLLDLAVVGLVAGAVEIGWLLYAHHTFGTYMPWTSTGRLIFYIPGRFGITSAAQYYSLGPVGRGVVAVKAAAYMLLGGPMKILLLCIPLLIAVMLLRVREGADAQRWMVRTAAMAMAMQIAVFAFLFPLAQNRHFAPYLAGLWALLVPAIVRFVHRQQRRVQWAAVSAVVLLWGVGAWEYIHVGRGDDPFRQLAASGQLHAGDRLATETIGIVSFETDAHIIDLGGLTDRDSWPLLMADKQANLNDVVTWDLQKGANKILLEVGKCGRWPAYGGACLFPADEAHEAVHELRPGSSAAAVAKPEPQAVE